MLHHSLVSADRRMQLLQTSPFVIISKHEPSKLPSYYNYTIIKKHLMNMLLIPTMLYVINVQTL